MLSPHFLSLHIFGILEKNTFKRGVFMKRKSVYFIMIFTVLACFALLFLLFLKGPNEKAVKSPEYSYIVQEYDGKIGVFKASEKTPFQVINMYTSLLPAYDQTELKSGIFIKDESELQQILEDFAS